jgi:hypothetical protein
MRLVHITLLGFVALAVACGSVSEGDDSEDDGGDDDGGAADADPGGGPGSDGGTGTDGSVDGAPVDGAPACAWTEPSLLDNVNDEDQELLPSLSDDGLELYFVVYGAAEGIYRASRGAPGQVFGPADPVDELSVADAFEYDPDISATGREIVYRRNTFDILSSSRGSTASAFGDPEPTGLAGVSPSLSGDGLALYFIDPAQDLVKRATRRAIGEPWSGPADAAPASGYNSVDVSRDERRLLLSRGPGDFDGPTVAIATRASVDDEFGAPESAGDGFAVAGDISFSTAAAWDGSATQMVLGVQFEGQASDLYISTCE